MMRAALLAALALVAAGCGYKPGPEVKDTRTTMTVIVTALNAYKKDVGKYPDKLAKLLEKPKPTELEAKKWKGPYIKDREVPLDGWQKEFQYFMPGKSGIPFDLISLGEDGKPGGKNDAQDLSHDSRSLPPVKK